MLIAIKRNRQYVYWIVVAHTFLDKLDVNKRNMKLGLLFIFAISLLDCDDDNLLTQTKLNGKWVDIDTKTDTLTFLVVSEHDFIQLDRGLEMRNGVLRPKNGFGPYYYKILSDKISLRWTLAASTEYNDYYFNQTDDSLVIENFYDLNSKGTKQTYKKIK